MDLFLSYARGEDDTFVARLYGRLREEGFEVWWDVRSMPSRSLTLMQEIRDAIDSVERVIVVLGPRAVTSDYVPAEWQHALAGGKVVVPVRRRGDFELVPAELRGFLCLDLTPGHDEGDGFANLLRVLADPVPEPGQLHGEVPAQTPHFQPRSEILRRLAEAVLIDLHPVEVKPPQRVTVVHGMGGVGKSVLAAAFARFVSTRRAFSDGVYWLHVGPETDPLAVLRGAAELLHESLRDYPDLASGVTALRRRLKGRKILIVLDDVWSIDTVRPFGQALDVRTRLLVTTRISGLASATKGLEVALSELSEPEALRHLADWTDTAIEDLPGAARQLARACGYLPLALALNGAMVRDGMAWSTLLEALARAKLDFAEHDLAEYPHETVSAAIDVSIRALTKADPDRCTRYRELVVFLAPVVPEGAIVRLWTRRGGMDELDVGKLLVMLDRRALLRLEGPAARRRVRLHALQRQYLLATTEDLAALNRALLDAYRETGSGGWATVPDDGYFRRHLVSHLDRLGEHEQIHELLRADDDHGANAWFTANEAIDNLSGYLADLERARRIVGPPELGDRSALARTLGHQLRYAAIQVSINSLTTTMPGEFRESMLRAGLMGPEQALAEAHRVSPGWRMKALLALVPDLEPDLARRTLDDALALARAQTEPRRQAWYLARVAHFLEGAERASVIDDGLAIARAIEEPFARSGALAYYLSVVAADERPALLDEAMAAFEAAVMAKAPIDRLIGPVGELARFGSEEQRIRLLDMVDPVGADLDCRIPLLPAFVQPAAAAAGPPCETFDELLERALSIPVTATVGVGLFPHAARFPEELRSLFEKLIEAGHEFDWQMLSRSLDDGGCRGAERATIEAAALSCFSIGQRAAVVERWLRAAEAMEDDAERRSAILPLCRFLDADQLRDVLAHIRRIGDQKPVATGLIELIPAVTEDTAKRIREFAQPLWKGKEHLELCARLVALAPTAWRHELVDEVLKAVERGAHVGGRSWAVADQGDALLCLHTFAAPDQREQAARQVEKWLKGNSWPTTERVLHRFLSQLPPAQAKEFAADALSTALSQSKLPPHAAFRAVQALLPLLPAESLPYFRDECESIRHEIWACAARMVVGDRLPADERAEIIAEALAFFGGLDEKDWAEISVRPLLVLAERLEGQSRDEMMERGVAAARMSHPTRRTDELLLTADRLPAGRADALRREAAATARPWQVVEVARALEPAAAIALRRHALIELVRDRPKELSAWNAYPAAIHGLAQAVSDDPIEQRWEALSQALDEISRMPRGDFAVCAAALTPLLPSLAGDDAVETFAKGVLDACRWWP